MLLAVEIASIRIQSSLAPALPSSNITAWVGAFCLKKNERLASLGYVLLMAAVIYTLWERRVRLALANVYEKPIEGLNRVKTKKPTSYALQTIMSGILVLYRILNGEKVIWLSKPLTSNQKRVVELSGFSSEIYEFRGIV